jgi:hypothetical protein
MLDKGGTLMWQIIRVAVKEDSLDVISRLEQEIYADHAIARERARSMNRLGSDNRRFYCLAKIEIPHRAQRAA